MIYSNSRYKDTKIMLDRNGVKVLNNRVKKAFNQSKCTSYMVKQGDTLDVIAYRYYGNSSFLWAILDNNPQFMSEIDIKAGDYLLMPSYKEVVNG